MNNDPSSVADMIMGAYGNRPAQTPQGPGLAGMNSLPPSTSKFDTFDPNLLAEAQNTFAGGTHAQGSPQGGQGQGEPGTNTPKKGTVGNMIPPGWSSQAAK